MSGSLIESLANTPALAALFSDESVLQAMLEFENTLARAEARHGLIPMEAADAIGNAAVPGNFDISILADATFRAGTPAIPLVRMLTDQVRKANAEAARFVHWGATSQDVADTAMSLLLKRAELILVADLLRLEKALAGLSERHRQTVMLGRTLLQSAPPVTFGLKAAGWLASVCRGRRRLQKAFRVAAVLQFGGASGTLASLGDRGIQVADTLSADLGFGDVSAVPWHTQRDSLATLICACGVLTGSLGKMARDISLLMQSEVAEEPSQKAKAAADRQPCRTSAIRRPVY